MKIAAIYCRLSKEDMDKENISDSSESIINQKLLLTDYAVEHGYAIGGIYSDDDYSGLYDSRPQFEKMIEDARAGKFDVIIAKSQSRFSRNAEHIEKYLHGEFVERGIRFIGVVDGTDTAVKSNKKSRQIVGLTNEWYCEDLSENIRAVFKRKMKDGQFIGAFAPYGYKKSPTDRHKMVIDEEAAVVVREIFDLCIEGYGCRAISSLLYDRGVPTPTQYKKNQGLNFSNPNCQYTCFGSWSTTTIKRILSNDVYIGTLTQGREKKVSYKSKKVVIAPKEDWVVIKNNHEAIVSEEVFEKAQAALSGRARPSLNFNSKDGKSRTHMFYRKLKCMDCGATLTKTTVDRDNKYFYYACQSYTKSRRKQCTRHSIRNVELVEVVENEIRELISEAMKNGEDCIRKQLKHMSKLNQNYKLVSKYTMEKRNYILKCKEIEDTISSLYMEKVNGTIEESMFTLLGENYKNRIETYKNRITELEDKITNLEKKSRSDEEFEEAIKSSANFERLTADIIDMFIDYIEVGEKDSKTGEQIINIHWQF